MKSANK